MNEILIDDQNFNIVTRLLLSFKFQPQMQGFDYIRSAVMFCMGKEHLVYGITTEVYPLLAKLYKTKETSIERNIRKCIDTAFQAGGLLSINQYLGAIVYTNKHKYSNSEIIAIIVEIIRLDNLKRDVCQQFIENDM